MALEQNSEHHNREVVDKYIDPNANVQMATHDYVVRPSADADSGPIFVILPPVTEAKGRFYSIVARNADAVNTITITDYADSECWLADITFDGKCDKMLFYSDGLCWHALGTGGPGEYPGLATTAAPGSTQPPTTVAPTTAGPSEAPTTGAATTVAPTTTGVTDLPTTEPVVATTLAPTTLAATTLAPTTLAPTTLAPTTLAPTTLAATTLAPTTLPPTTLAPTTLPPTTL